MAFASARRRLLCQVTFLPALGRSCPDSLAALRLARHAYGDIPRQATPWGRRTRDANHDQAPRSVDVPAAELSRHGRGRERGYAPENPSRCRAVFRARRDRKRRVPVLPTRVGASVSGPTVCAPLCALHFWCDVEHVGAGGAAGEDADYGRRARGQWWRERGEGDGCGVGGCGASGSHGGCWPECGGECALARGGVTAVEWRGETLGRGAGKEGAGCGFAGRGGMATADCGHARARRRENERPEAVTVRWFARLGILGALLVTSWSARSATRTRLPLAVLRDFKAALKRILQLQEPAHVQTPCR